MAFLPRAHREPMGCRSPIATTRDAVVLLALLRRIFLGSSFGLWLLLALASHAGWATAQQLQPIPPLTAHIVDRTSTLSADQRAQLENRLTAFEREKGAQIAVLLVPTIQPETIEAYALRVAESWKLGRKGIDDGALLLIVKNDRELRIEVGYGLEGALNDATAKRIINEIITPRFRAGDFYGGIDAGVSAILKVVGGEALPAPSQTPNRKPGKAASLIGSGDLSHISHIAFFCVLIVFNILRAFFGRFIAAVIVGIAAGAIATLLLSSMVAGIVLGLIAFVFALFSDGVSGISSGRGRSDGGSFGSSGGGFSGGGGSFGGGGASGRW